MFIYSVFPGYFKEIVKLLSARVVVLIFLRDVVHRMNYGCRFLYPV